MTMMQMKIIYRPAEYRDIMKNSYKVSDRLGEYVADALMDEGTFQRILTRQQDISACV